MALGVKKSVEVADAVERIAQAKGRRRREHVGRLFGLANRLRMEASGHGHHGSGAKWTRPMIGGGGRRNGVRPGHTPRDQDGKNGTTGVDQRGNSFLAVVFSVSCSSCHGSRMPLDTGAPNVYGQRWI